MKRKFSVIVLWAVAGFGSLATAGNLERIGHTTLTPRHTSPDDKGMYTAFIDATNGYAYFVGSYLFKLDITGNLPVQIGPALSTGQFSESAIDRAMGCVYVPKSTLFRFSLGVGTNAVASAGLPLTLTAGSASCIAIDDSDPNTNNHYAYVLCTTSGAPAKVAKVALSTFTEFGSVALTATETNYVFGTLCDAKKGYAYFVSFVSASGAIGPEVVKIKMTSGTNSPVRVGAVSLDPSPVFIDGGSIDTVHGFAYYGTYDSNTNIPGKVYKVKLEDGDAAPTLVGKVSLKAGEGRLSASVLDPVNGFVYFANDNTYPGDICQLSLNGTNVPVEINYFPLQGGTNSIPPPNGITTNNWADDGTNLPFGEVFFRSAVFDPVRGYAYFGQDSRPNQVVKVKLAAADPITLASPTILPSGLFQFTFSNIAGGSFSAWTATNLTQSSSNWTVLGTPAEISPGHYQFTDPQPANKQQRFYRVSFP